MSHSRTLVVPPQSRIAGRSGSVRSGSHAHELVQELERDFGLSKHSTELRARKMEFSDGPSDVRPPVELSQPGVVSVRCNHRTGQKTIEYRDGRRETRAFVIDQQLAGLNSRRPQLESPRVIVAALEAEQQREKREAKEAEAKLTPRQIVKKLERRYGLTSCAVGLSERDFQMYVNDSVIRRPDGFDEMLRARQWEKYRAQCVEVADLCRRWETLKRTKMLDVTYIAKQPVEEF